MNLPAASLIGIWTAAIWMIGCATDTATVTEGATIDGPLIVSGKTADSPSDDGIVRGVIVFDDDGCLKLNAPDGDLYGIAWPSGTSWEDDDQVIVLTDARRIRPGDTVRTSGGYHPYDTLDPEAVSVARDCGVQQVGVMNGDPALIEIEAS